MTESMASSLYLRPIFKGCCRWPQVSGFLEVNCHFTPTAKESLESTGRMYSSPSGCGCLATGIVEGSCGPNNLVVQISLYVVSFFITEDVKFTSLSISLFRCWL